MKSIIWSIAIFSFFLLMSERNIAQTWTTQSSSGSGLTSVSFADANNGIAVSYAGLIRNTTNAGSTWNDQTVGSANMNGVSFVGVNGTAVGNSGQIIRTTNSGTSWTTQTSNTSFVLYAVSFLDANNGIVAGWGEIVRTTNGGTNWASVDVSTMTANKLFGISFPHSTNGTAVGEGGKILRTTNGGTSWTEQTSGTVNTLNAVSFTDANNGTAVGVSGTILKTTNGGTNWSLQTVGTADLNGVSFTDANNGTAVGANGTILRTINGGTNWTTQTSGTTNNLYGVSFTDADKGTAVGIAGTILRTTNGSLPVEITSFTARLNGSNIDLNWKTATEVNNYGFEIERIAEVNQSLQGNGSFAWKKIGFVEGNGTTNAPKSYSYIDNTANGKVVYRLKQIDRDGKFEYSKEVEVTIANTPKEFSLLQNYPNPFNPTTMIGYQISVNGYVSLKVYDAVGREVATLVNKVKEAGNYSASFDATKLSSGIYFAKLQSGENVQLKKMVLMK